MLVTRLFFCAISPLSTVVGWQTSEEADLPGERLATGNAGVSGETLV